MNKELFNEHTPIEEYKIDSDIIYVKREDLYCLPPMPPLAKLRGIKIVVSKLYDKGIRRIGVLDTRVSKSGQGVAAICNVIYPEMKLLLGFPVTRSNNTIPLQHTEAEKLGATLLPQQGTRQAIMYYRFKRIVEEQDGIMLPHGLPFIETAKSVMFEASLTPKELCQGTLVMIVGTGTMMSGVLAGLPVLPKRIIGISAGKDISRQLTTINNMLNALLLFEKRGGDKLNLLAPIMPYEKESNCDCPFPAHPNYDKKAWEWLIRNKDNWNLPRPILFWNIGA